MEVFVFDLDFTLWNAGDVFCSETSPPYYWEKGQLLDQKKRRINLYPDVPTVLKTLKDAGKTLCVASRTNKPEWARQLLTLLDIDQYFSIKEIYPGSKVTHLKNIRETVNCRFSQIIFFDDEILNIEENKVSGVNCVWVKNGITINDVINAL